MAPLNFVKIVFRNFVVLNTPGVLYLVIFTNKYLSNSVSLTSNGQLRASSHSLVFTIKIHVIGTERRPQVKD
jgi:hypothetical protein